MSHTRSSSSDLLPSPSSSSSSSSSVTSISGSLSTLQHHFDLQLAQLLLVEQSLKTHFHQTLNSTSSNEEEGTPPSPNPIQLLTRLHHLKNETLPQLNLRMETLLKERSKVEDEIETLRSSNRKMLTGLQQRIEHASSSTIAASNNSTSLPPSSDSSSPSKSLTLTAAATVKSRPSTAPPPTQTTPVNTNGRRKSVRPIAPPSPSTLVEQALLEQIHSSSELEGPISESEFAAVSTTVKSRVKLVDVNHMLSVIQTYFQRYVSQHKCKDPSSLTPLTLTTLAEEGGLKIGGATSQCMIGTLRACKRIIVGKTGILLVKPPIGNFK